MQKVLLGNNIDLLKEYPDNYFDSVVTDPPYGLGKEPNAEEMLTAWLKEGYMEVKGAGFMGKEWDSFVPQPNFWKEVFRVLKPGSHVLSFFGTRTYDWGVMAMRLAGFEVRDCMTFSIAKQKEKEQGVRNNHALVEELIGFQIYINTEGLITNHDWDFEKIAKKYVKSLKQQKKEQL